MSSSSSRRRRREISLLFSSRCSAGGGEAELRARADRTVTVVKSYIYIREDGA